MCAVSLPTPTLQATGMIFRRLFLGLSAAHRAPPRTRACVCAQPYCLLPPKAETSARCRIWLFPRTDGLWRVFHTPQAGRRPYSSPGTRLLKGPRAHTRLRPRSTQTTQTTRGKAWSCVPARFTETGSGWDLARGPQGADLC